MEGGFKDEDIGGVGEEGGTLRIVLLAVLLSFLRIPFLGIALLFAMFPPHHLLVVHQHRIKILRQRLSVRSQHRLRLVSPITRLHLWNGRRRPRMALGTTCCRVRRRIDRHPHVDGTLPVLRPSRGLHTVVHRCVFDPYPNRGVCEGVGWRVCQVVEIDDRGGRFVVGSGAVVAHCWGWT